jgi:hypothetical protein
MNTAWQKRKAAGQFERARQYRGGPYWTIFANFLLSPTTEMLSFFQQLRD